MVRLPFLFKRLLSNEPQFGSTFFQLFKSKNFLLSALMASRHFFTNAHYALLSCLGCCLGEARVVIAKSSSSSMEINFMVEFVSTYNSVCLHQKRAGQHVMGTKMLYRNSTASALASRKFDRRFQQISGAQKSIKLVVMFNKLENTFSRP